MIREAIRKRHLIDWIIMVVVAACSTYGVYQDRLVKTPVDPLVWHVLPVFFVAMFLVTWIIIAYIDGS